MVEPLVPATAPSRRLAAIMFTDLVGYSALAHRDQALAIELLELHRQMVREILPKHSGQEIETVGDAFLVEFAGALAAVECAVAIQLRLAEYNKAAPEDRRMELRIGIHLGDVEHKDGKVMGDGVNIASRIHGMAEPGGICVSEDIHHVVRNCPGLGFRSLGAPDLKNIATKVELFHVLPDAKPGNEPTGPVRWQAALLKRRYAIPALAAVAIVASGVGLWLSERAPDRPTPAVAVLPFANMSADRDNEYFADGMHDALLSNLARIRDLRVISRTSVMEYRDTARNLREIGEALGAAHIVEGSVQRQGSRVRITAQLIDAGTDEHVWAETYDRDIADLFAIQSEVAQRIAVSVQGSLSAAERGRLEERPTRNTEAYEAYLRAEYEWRGFGGRASLERAIALYERALALDPMFALAHAAVSRVHGNMYWFDHDRTDERMALSLASAQRALDVDPELHEGRMALGEYYRLRREYDRAYPLHLELARARPNDAEAVSSLAYVERRQGRFADAAAHLRQAIESDPLNAGLRISLVEVLILLRDYAGASAVLDQALGLPRSDDWGPVMKTAVHLAWKGDLSAIGALPHVSGWHDGDRSYFRYIGHLWSGQYDKATAVAEAWSDDFMPMIQVALGSNFVYAKAYLVGLAYRADGDHVAAERHFQQAKAVLEAAIGEQPDDARLYANLAVTLAGLGEREAALAAARKATEMMPISRDAMVGPVVSQMVAQTYAWLGDADAAIAILEDLLEGPTHVTAHALRLNPVWGPLRDHPRFQKLIADHLPTEVST